eukprot:gnl/MRDRNA2_/MRDRNA2_87446_c0_seq1.p1 gnl/MRDRNA2_/MRDRNA2_87446_c0~~gnl/MRDRNA2_/MRDRNA2_87446_c0_seq1.p1  ORF type:complete len:697 (-),score=219.62 gnl/MRDRNA2_/MRDRNA2_87446_c0_seq1:76-2166(-)
MKLIVLLLGLCGLSLGTRSKNPIRKIITLMQRMQKEVEAEGEKEKELNAKFVCYCTATHESLTAAERGATEIVDQLSAKLKGETAQKSQLEQELGEHKTDREAAKGDLDEASMLREKEAEEFAAVKADSETNIEAMGAAIIAIEKGLNGAALLQLPGCGKLKQIISDSNNLDTEDQRELLVFLEGGSSTDDFAPGTGQVLGMLKQMKDEFEVNLQGAMKTEDAALSSFASLKADKEKEIEVATESIETKMARTGELAVSIAKAQDGLEDGKEEIEDTTKALDSLKTQCATKEKEYSLATKDRADEMKALSEAISVLNDDDALAMLQKAVPTGESQDAAPTFLQKSMTSHIASSRASKAQVILRKVAIKSASPQLNLMFLSLGSKIRLASTSGAHKFQEVVKMIDGMITLLGKQQQEDDKMKEWCRSEFDKADDEEKKVKTELGRLQSSLDESADAIETLNDEIQVLKKQITDLDYTISEATVQRKEEHAQFQESLAAQEASIALIGKAKKKLEKFYKPALVQQTTSSPTAQEDVVLDGGSFVQVKAHSWSLEDATEDSGTDSAVNQRAAKGGGVFALMDMIIHDTQMTMKDAENAEKEAVSDYAKVMADAQANRALDSKSIVDKDAVKAELEAKMVKEKESVTGQQRELMIVGKLIADLHKSCDFLVQNYDLRKEARTSEMDSLKNAKAILSGAAL